MQLYKTKIELDKCLNSVKRKIWGFDDLMLSRGAPRQYNVEDLRNPRVVLKNSRCETKKVLSLQSQNWMA